MLKQRLSVPQRDELRRFGRFTVRAPSGRLFRIHRSDYQNIYEVNRKGRRINRICWYMTGPPIPQADQMLAQMIMLTADEDEFLRVANVRPEAR